MPDRNLNVLLVCDEPTWAKYVCSVFVQWGHSVKPVETFEEGEKEVTTTDYDMIIVDCPFSTEVKYQASMRIRKEMKNPNFIVSTWDIGQSEIEQLMRLQVADLIMN